ncbi:hypothetical protein BDN70DRAFT_878340 [Pholiota conissans]|uniref:Uncharacterized protein n=1 Tax=Pholiota conissans TaxID=109636 RepID=A0A9P5Z4J7_9AGAR|nr:hypothetical protein BDN70DRAFT_878340 [Pholiota conissans]
MLHSSLYGKVIHLEPNTLHICMTMLLAQPGLFHWSLYMVDTNGIATRYHWTTDVARASRDLPYEHFQYYTVNPVMEINDTLNQNLAFIRLDAYQLKPDTTPESFALHIQGIFETSYNNVRQNREAKISCRTWLLAALQKLRQVGYLALTSEEVCSLERKAINIAKEVEDNIAESITVKVTSI